jgi:response regulator RpfG family c-di-GMP phosphodiesterase
LKDIVTLFYVDDDEDDLSFFKQAINELGQQVHLFNLGDDLIKALDDPPPFPSIVFLDLNMHHKTGFEILYEIRQAEKYKALPVVIYSTAVDFQTIRKCRYAGANLFITKPTSLNSLKRALKYVMEIAWEERQLNDKNFLYLP